MSLASAVANAILEAWLRGTAPTLPTGIYVSLHTADPGNTGASEVGTGAWPAYVREDAAQGGSMSSGWAAAASGYTSNAKQLIWPAYDGAGTITITHFGLWDAATAGNFIEGGKLVSDPTNVGSTATPKTLGSTDQLVINVNQLGVTAT